MPGPDSQVLERLRGVFFDELEDQLAVMETQLAVFVEPEQDPANRSAALNELYRATHSLKGAAGAVAWEEPERICHRLEETLASARQPGWELDVRAIAEPTLLTIAQLKTWATQQRPADAKVTEDSDALPSQRGGARDLRSEPPPSDVSQARQGTVRIELSRLDELLRSIDEWLAHLSESPSMDGARFEQGFSSNASPVTRPTTNPSEAARQARDMLVAKSEFEAARLEERRYMAVLRARAVEVARQVRALRVQQLSELGAALESAAREAAAAEAKEVNFRFVGGEASADYRVVERLREPLLQLVRNAVVHGIEAPQERVRAGKPSAGSLDLQVRVEGTELSIVVSDDGAGFRTDLLREAALTQGHAVGGDGERELLDLAFLPGLSTHAQASRRAGRGIGMDIVRDRIARLHGRLALSSKRGKGAVIQIQVPVDLSLLEVLLVGAAGSLFAVPSSTVKRLRRLNAHELVDVDGMNHISDDGGLVVLSDLCALVDGHAAPVNSEQKLECVVLEALDQTVAIRVESLLEAREVVVKPLADRARTPLVQAAVVLSDGRVAPLLDVQALCDTGRTAQLRFRASATTDRPACVLVVDDSVTTRQLVRIILETEGYLVHAEANGERAWNRLRSGERFDAVVTDIEMPVVGGLELLTRIRSSARFRELPVVLITALVNDEHRRRALDLGADAYVIKSKFDQQALLDTLRELLE